MTVLFMGDSITAGQYVETPLRWTDLVEAQFRDAAHAAAEVSFVNCGVSGDTTRTGLERFPRDVQSRSADVVTIQFGLNDCNCWATDGGLPRVSVAAFRANLVEMIQRARRFGTREIIVCTTHPTLREAPLSSGQTLNDARRSYDAAARDVAREQGTALCDVDHVFSALHQPELSAHLLPAPDLLHLSPIGHERYAAAIGPLVVLAVDRLTTVRS